MIISDAELAASFAIFAAKQAGAEEVTPDHLLLGCLQTISRFGIATIGPWDLDLQQMGVDWIEPPDGARPKVAYSQGAVDLFDRAARIARSTGEKRVDVDHLLVAFAMEEDGLMGELKREYGITSASWRAALAHVSSGAAGAPVSQAESEKKIAREYLTPEEAAEALGVHVQTMRAYIRSERLPAYRVAGERAIRILRTDLAKVLEPLGKER